MTGKVIDDIVIAEIVPTNLYSLIRPVKEQHFADFGRVWDYNYEKKMLALTNKKPQQRLQNDRIAREIVRAILSAKQWGLPTLVKLEGCRRGGVKTYGVTTFPEVSDEDIKQRLCDLFYEDGLLDVLLGNCTAPDSWCFESEIIYYKQRVPGFDEKPTMENMVKYVANKPLREALTAMLKPFEAEQPLYIHPERR